MIMVGGGYHGDDDVIMHRTCRVGGWVGVGRGGEGRGGWGEAGGTRPGEDAKRRGKRQGFAVGKGAPQSRSSSARGCACLCVCVCVWKGGGGCNVHWGPAGEACGGAAEGRWAWPQYGRVAGQQVDNAAWTYRCVHHAFMPHTGHTTLSPPPEAPALVPLGRGRSQAGMGVQCGHPSFPFPHPSASLPLRSRYVGRHALVGVVNLARRLQLVEGAALGGGGEATGTAQHGKAQHGGAAESSRQARMM